MELNVDCQCLIFEGLQTNDLYALTKTNKYYANFAGQIFGQRLAKANVIFNTLNRSELGITEKTSHDLRWIKIQNTKVAFDILKRFGRYIRFLKIESSEQKHLERGPNEISEVYNLIQEHCSESLLSFHYKATKDDNFFEHVKRPFKSVQNVLLEYDVIGLGNDRLNFQQIFPALRSLHINMVKIDDASALTHHFPCLINVIVASLDAYVNHAIVPELVRKNPQILSITLDNIFENVLRDVATNLVNLEELTLCNILEDNLNTNIHFEQVKIFRVCSPSEPSMPANIRFSDEQLEEFDANIDSHDHKYIDFIERNRNLKKIHLYGHYGLDRNDTERLASANLSVLEMSLYCWIEVDVEILVRLIKNSKQLTRFHIKIDSNERTQEDFTETLRSSLENEWILNMELTQNSIDVVGNRSLQNETANWVRFSGTTKDHKMKSIH